MLPKFLTHMRLWLFALAVTMGLTGCWAINDIIAPPMAEVGESVFMTRQLKPAFADAEQQLTLTHQWDFGDGTTAAGNDVEHTYTQAGEYTVVLTATDTEGQTFESQHVIKVIPPASGPLNVAVLTADNQLVSGAAVTINGETRTTVEDFPAQFSNIPTSRYVLIRVKAEGYVATSVLLDPLLTPPAGARQAVIHLMPLAAAQQVEDIAQAQTLRSTTLEATVTVPSDAFVSTTGQAATGAASITITPWDITNPLHMTSFHGDRRAADDVRKRLVRLISFGMMDVKVTSADGVPLQLAEGKTAQIQMDLPITTDENGTALAVGDTIPLWHFEEAEGLWYQEGQGQIVASATSASGLAVAATVSHFSSWNWDRIEGGQSVAITRTIRCAASAASDTLVKPCAIVVKQTLPNGSVLTNQLEAPEGTVDFASFVPTAAVQITAVSVESLRRGAVSVPLVSDSVAVLDVVMAEQLTMLNPLDGIPVLKLTTVPAVFLLPDTVLANGSVREIRVNQIKISRDNQEWVKDTYDYAYLAGSYPDTFTGSDGKKYVMFSNLLNQIDFGLPGAIADGKFNGDLSIQANATYSKRTADGNLESGAVPLIAHINVPVINRVGPALSANLSNASYILWEDFSAGTYAAVEGDIIAYTINEVTASSGGALIPINSETVLVGSGNKFSMWLPPCSQYYPDPRAFHVFDITVTSAKNGSVTKIKSRPTKAVRGMCVE